jgi:hydroxyacyl-ACP dehydratase HTD2-like protein with hotdog domain
MDKSDAFFDNVRENVEVKTLTKKPTHMQLFMFSAVTWNRHLIHYNTEFAKSDGLKEVATHRALMGSFLAQMLSDWVGDFGRVSKVEWTVRGGAFPGEVLTCKGKVLQKRAEGDEKSIECEIWIENQEGKIIVPGKGKVTIFN